MSIAQVPDDGKKLTGVYAGMKEMARNLTDMFKEITGGVQTLTSSTISEIASNTSKGSQTTLDAVNRRTAQVSTAIQYL